MQYRIRLTQPLKVLQPIEEAIRAVDPAAQVDIDKPGENLRVAAHIEAAELVDLLGHAGLALHSRQVVQLPSICCGGCGG